MPSNLYQSVGGGALPPNLQNIMRQFQQFKTAFQGDPRQQVQALLNSGRVTQTQYNQAVQIANQLSRMMGNK